MAYRYNGKIIIEEQVSTLIGKYVRETVPKMIEEGRDKRVKLYTWDVSQGLLFDILKDAGATVELMIDAGLARAIWRELERTGRCRIEGLTMDDTPEGDWLP